MTLPEPTIADHLACIETDGYSIVGE